MGVVRLLDVGKLSVEQVVTMIQGADLQKLTSVWDSDTVEPRRRR